MNETLSQKQVQLDLLSDFDGTTNETLRTALDEYAQAYNLEYLLAYHDDGVVWGYFDGQAWHFSSDAFPKVSPLFRTLTLQQAHAFGRKAEVRLWRADDVLHASVLREDQGNEHPYFDRAMLLWGTAVDGRADGFTLLREGRQGLRHAVSLPTATVARQKRTRLIVRHYVDYDKETHQAYVKWSRLVDLTDPGEDDVSQA
ncbi:MAG: type III-D CRISPR-associated protein Csx19 [Ardenticatenaceae bacterium]